MAIECGRRFGNCLHYLLSPALGVFLAFSSTRSHKMIEERRELGGPAACGLLEVDGFSTHFPSLSLFLFFCLSRHFVSILSFLTFLGNLFKPIILLYLLLHSDLFFLLVSIIHHLMLLTLLLAHNEKLCGT